MLEMGYTGVICKIIGYIIVFIYGLKLCRIRKEIDIEKWGLFTCCCAVLCIILFFYNNTLEDYYTAYIVAMGLASSTIAKKKLMLISKG
jgi:hypothetical protein